MGEGRRGAVLLLIKFKLIQKFQLTSAEQKSALSKSIQTSNSEHGSFILLFENGIEKKNLEHIFI